ncbi:hypothetical protein [Halovenus salina]|uniref:Ribbon-helix-helix protein, copG family n=1 Tax=Halovenus salina TaxID=1510225 RepID=A0ABD5W780_9EURY|nr:hypothetical protein [Halovenus salina]
MQRYSISFDDELAGWVESRAAERGVSKAKVIRDAVATAREIDTDLVQTGDVLSRLEDLEQRVDALEQTREEAVGDELAETSADHRDLDVSMEDDTSDTEPDEFLAEIKAYLADQRPRTETGQTAMLTAFERLREVERAQTADLREYVYERHSEEYTDANSLWQSVQRDFDDVPGVEKAGHGEWVYAGDETAREELNA